MSRLLRSDWRSLVDFSPLDGVLGARTAPSDLDRVEGRICGVLERRAHFLILECKQLGEALSEGQRIMLEALARETTNKTVLVVELDGSKNELGVPVFAPVRYRPVNMAEWHDTSLDQFVGGIEKWEQSLRGLTRGTR